MKKILLILGILLTSSTSLVFARGAGSVSVHGYTKSNGTYVSPHYRSASDHSFYNNWSTKGNINPYTGKTGTLKTPHYSLPDNTRSTILLDKGTP